MQSILLLVNVVVAVLLVITVLLQRAESSLGAGFGGSTNPDAGQTAQKPLIKATSVLALIFLFNLLLMGWLSSREDENRSVIERIEAPEATLIPSIPAPLEDVPTTEPLAQ